MEEQGVHISWIALIVLLAGLTAEIASGKHRGIWTRNDAIITGLTFLLGFSASKLLTGVLLGWGLAMLLPQFQGVLADQPVLPWYLGILIVEDTVFYFIHRAAHDTQRHRVLWRMHRVHHAPPYVNNALVLRVHPVYYFVFPALYTIAFAIYTGMTEVAMLLPATHVIWQVWVHSAWRLDAPFRRYRVMRPFFFVMDRFLTSPTLHHLHHGAGANGSIHHNFAGMFATLDWIFGTLKVPDAPPERYGLPMWRQPWTEQVFYPLFQARRDRASPMDEPSDVVPHEAPRL